MTLEWRKIRDGFRGTLYGVTCEGVLNGTAYYLSGSKRYCAKVSINLNSERVIFREAYAGTMRGAISRLCRQLDKESIGLFGVDDFSWSIL